MAEGLKRVKGEFGASGIGAVGHASSTSEELHLLAKIVRGLGSENIDHRLRHADASQAAPAAHARWLGLPLADLSKLDCAYVIGSFLRKDHPLFALRLRHAVRHGAQLHSLHAVHDDWLINLATRQTAAPADWPLALAQVAVAVAAARGIEAPVQAEASAEASAEAHRIAASLLSGERAAVLLGNAAAWHPQAAQLLALAQWIAQATGARCGYLGEAGNSVGAQLVNAVPGAGGLSAAQMLSQSMKALLLLHTEPVLDSADAAAAKRALLASGLVVALTPFKDALADVADVMLPIAPFTETAGCFVNAEGRVQSFHGVVKPLADARPAWKVLRVLGNLLGLAGFGHETVEDVRAEALGDIAELASRLDNAAAQSIAPVAAAKQASAACLQRVADVPIYATDSLVRRAPSLQATADGAAPVAGLSAALWAQLGLQAGDRVRVTQAEGSAELQAREDASLAEGTLRVSAGHPLTAELGAMFGAISVQKV